MVVQIGIFACLRVHCSDDVGRDGFLRVFMDGLRLSFDSISVQKAALSASLSDGARSLFRLDVA